MCVFTKRIVALLTALATLIICFSGCSVHQKGEKVDNFKVTTYIRGDYVQSADSLYAQDFDVITDVILFECASFDNEGNVVYEKEKLETALTNIRNTIGERDIHITLNLLGPSGNTDSTVWEEQMEAQSNEHNKAFTSGVLEDNIIAVLNEYGFDGVHFDYEYPLSRRAWRHYNKFLVSLDEKLGDYTLGVACSDWNIKFTKSAIKAIDTFELMVYDFVDDEGKHATYEGSVEIVEKSSKTGIPYEKINIGLPFYSRPTDMSAYWYGYNSCYKAIDENGWYHCTETNKNFWFNTPEVIKKKTEYALTNGYGGVMIWHYNCDLPVTDDVSLLKAIGTAVESIN